MLYTAIKFIICVFVVPSILLNFLIKRIYGMSIIEVMVYFFKHFKEVRGEVALIVLSVIFLPMMLFPLAGLINYTWVSSFGIEKSYVYVGGDEADGYYVDLNNTNTLPITGPYLGEALSFDDVYWVVDVYHDPNEPHYVGELKSRGEGLSLIALISFSISGFLIVFTALTYYARLVYEHKHSENIKRGDPTPFDLFLTRLHLSEGAYFFMLIALLFISVGLQLSTETVSSNRYKDFSSLITPGNKIQVSPYKVEVVYTTEHKTTDSQGRQGVNKVETSIRDIFVKIEKGVEIPVFLMFSIDIEEQPGYYAFVLEKIKNNEDLLK